MLRKSLIIALLLIASLLIFIKTSQPPCQTLHGEIYGTRYKVVYCPHRQLSIDHEGIKIQVAQELQRIDQIASGWKDDSEIARLNNAPSRDTFPLSEDLKQIIAHAEEIEITTNGAFDIRHLGDKIDLSGIAKGYAVDRISHYLHAELQIPDCLVEIGGEVKAHGSNPKGKPWTVALYIPPSHPHISAPRLELRDTSIATSGQYFKADHIRQPATGAAVANDLLSCSVIHPSNTTADALATALYTMGTETGLKWAKKHQINAIFIKNDGSIIKTRFK